MIKLVREKIKVLYRKGLFHIFGTSIINNIIQFVTNIFIVNLVSKNSYGTYTYANNIVSFFLIVRGLGLCSGLLQFASEEINTVKKQEIYGYVLKIGNRFNIFLTILMFIWVSIIDVKIEGAKTYLYVMLLLPSLQWMFDYVTTVFRVKQDNISFAKITNINTVLYFFFSVIGVFLGDAVGIVFGRYAAYIVSIIISLKWLKYDLHNLIKYRTKEFYNKKSILRFSITACANNSLSELLYLLDVFLLGIFISDASYIASYKVATQIPTALAFIPMGVITFVYPYFAMHNKEKKWIKDNFIKLIYGLAVINGIISIVLYFSAPFVIKFFWGQEYLDSLIPFRILVINYFFLGTFRIPSGNVLAMLRKVHINFIISVVSSLSNIVLDIVLIKMYGATGAAFATLAVVLISGTLSFIYLFKLIFSKKEFFV